MYTQAILGVRAVIASTTNESACESGGSWFEASLGLSRSQRLRTGLLLGHREVML